MTIVNFGSINLDFVYQVDHLARPGETVPSLGQEQFAGGKGFNQSIALARAGAPVRHVGRVGEDGRWLVEMLEAEGVDISEIAVSGPSTGHAIIQVDAQGENSILVHGGANREIESESLERSCAALGEDDWVLLQNETNALAAVMELAPGRGSRMVLNPSPTDPSLLALPLDRIDTFLINQGEGEALCGEREPGRILEAMAERFPRSAVVLTLGARGALYAREETRLESAAEPARALDTTGAGDTFAGYYLAEMVARGDPERALRLGCIAAGYCVERAGAAASIPRRSDLARGRVQASD
ncbi:MAG: ribokinase [Myxococcota bacterium]|nr:ribokinase [Myxococcota bacterium]